MNLLEHSSRKNLCISVTSILLLTLSITTIAIPRPTFATTASSTGIVIPLYTYPTDSTWTTAIQVHNAHPNVPMVVIVDPTTSGSGPSIDQNYVSGIHNLQAAGITVLGYV